ncbi:hypothetical protein N1851_024385 [Merluccius polli]|uniref:Uncharacterized protein n=1 Tax=Merluccius polli TaxID=89951 RepID=A0AA47NUJ2_MERPO|nr:hypothetical protein N1851_024385 [Merluccius polli]
MVRNKKTERRWRYKPRLPSVIMGSVRSLPNKTDELSALITGQREYRECSTRADRDKQSGKKSGGGLAVFVNSKWCNPGYVTTKDITCTPDVELLAVGLRPYYLPREFSAAIVVIVYTPSSAVAARACDIIHSTVADLQTRHPNALIIVNGDFNHVNISKTLTDFTQYVTCSTRGDKTGLTALYKPLVRRQPITTRSVEAEEALMECYRTTDWEMFQEDYNNHIEGLTQCVTDYIKFCEESVVPTKKVRCFPNSKPWINRDIKVLLNRKRRAFMAMRTHRGK